MTTKAFIIILLLTLLLGGVTGFFIHKSYFDIPAVSAMEVELNKAEILRKDSAERNTRAIRDSLLQEIKKLHDLENK